jgi:ubiquinone/menaquinone biosynthesis C-methylase UbiE
MGWYDWINDKMASAKDMQEVRPAFLKNARGKTLEVGFGTGLNAAFYPDTVESVVAIEPRGGAEKKARDRIASAKVPIEWRQGPGEKLPFDDASFDTVLTTLVLCTKVSDPNAILSEIKRVLKPGGRYLFWEHGHSPTEKGQKMQHTFNGLHKLVIGCRLDAPIRTLIEGARFSRFEKFEDFYMKSNPPFVHMYQGIAIR